MFTNSGKILVLIDRKKASLFCRIASLDSAHLLTLASA